MFFKKLKLFCLFFALSLLFTNCYMDSSVYDSSHPFKSEDSHISSPESHGNSHSEFNPSTFSWDNVHFINGGVILNKDISGWPETSEITSFSMSTRGICIDHTQRNIWHETVRPGFDNNDWQAQGTPWIFIPRNGTIYATTYEHLRSKHDPMMNGVGQTCKLSRNTLTEVIAALVEHAKKLHLTGNAQDEARKPIADWYPQPGDILGFAVSTSGSIREATQTERSDIVWIRVPDYNTVNSGGEIVGRTSGSSTTTSSTTTTAGGNTGGGGHQAGQCSPTPNTCVSGVHHPHPKDTLTEYRWTCRNIPHSTGETPCKAPRTAENCGPDPHFKTVRGQCLPSCGALAFFKNVDKQDSQLQSGSQCQTGWTRLGDSYEEALHGRSVCCMRN